MAVVMPIAVVAIWIFCELLPFVALSLQAPAQCGSSWAYMYRCLDSPCVDRDESPASDCA